MTTVKRNLTCQQMTVFPAQRLLDPAVDNVGNGGSEFDGGKSEPR